eukprot:SAG31_NODE_28107_length_415_cov_0.981013_2_plen_72_part_01
MVTSDVADVGQRSSHIDHDVIGGRHTCQQRLANFLTFWREVYVHVLQSRLSVADPACCPLVGATAPACTNMP